MVKKLKKALYFSVASYFRFFARISLRKWDPRVIVVTGSQGKTTLLHMLEAQLGGRAYYSHRANSSFGICFHILGLERKTFGAVEWLRLFVSAPFGVFKSPRPEKIYVVEADCSCPHEGTFLASLLTPSITLWVSASRTHSMNFPAQSGKTIEQVIAHEFGAFARATGDMVAANGDVPEIVSVLEPLLVRKYLIKESECLTSFTVEETGTHFVIDGAAYSLPVLVPKDAARSIKMTELVCKELGVAMDPAFSKLVLPPGRSSIFRGIKERAIIDSSYNASPESMRAMLELFALYPKNPKWIILGDMLELGAYEKEEHAKLAEEILKLNPDRVILVGPRLRESTYPLLVAAPGYKYKTFSFIGPNEALAYITWESAGGEAMLFKGARFLEGIIERILYNQNDSALLPRREKVWQKRREQWNI